MSDALLAHARALAGTPLGQLFAQDPSRAARLALDWGEWRIDVSKERITPDALAALVAHAESVGVRAWSADGHVSLTIEDDGRGFDPAEVEARREEGHLGLNLMQQLAEDEGAELTIDSEPGHGTTVTARVEEVST